jgi:lysophospholipase L1-like esterase
VLLVGLGDSVTSGFGVHESLSYFGRLAKNPPDEIEDMRGLSLSAVMPNLSVRNLAVAGSNSFFLLEQQLPKLQVQPPEVLGIVVISTGGNDLIHEYGRKPPREGAMYGATIEQAEPWIASFQTRLGRIISETAQKFPGGCHIFIADIYDPTDGQGVPWIAPYPEWKDQVEILIRYNDVIRRAGEGRSNVHFVPMHDAFLGHGYCCSRFWKNTYHRDDPTFWYAMNIEDPTVRGYDAIRRLFLLEMIPVLTPGAPQ